MTFTAGTLCVSPAEDHEVLFLMRAEIQLRKATQSANSWLQLVCVCLCVQLEVEAPRSAAYSSLSLFYFLSQSIIPSLLPKEINVSICISFCPPRTLLVLKPLHWHCCFRKYEVMVGDLATYQICKLFDPIKKKERAKFIQREVSWEGWTVWSGKLLWLLLNKTQIPCFGGLHVNEFPSHICKVSGSKQFEKYSYFESSFGL